VGHGRHLWRGRVRGFRRRISLGQAAPAGSLLIDHSIFLRSLETLSTSSKTQKF